VTEPEALRLLGQGREIDRAFEFLVNRHKDVLFGFLCRRTGSEDDAEELVQQTFIMAFKRIRRFRPGRCEFSTWLCGIGLNLWLHLCRARQRQQAGLAELARCSPILGPGPDESAIAEARADMVWKFLGRLRFEEQLVAVLHFLEGLSFPEINRVFGIPERTAKYRYRRALLLLHVQAVVERDRIRRLLQGEWSSDRTLR